MRTCYLKQQPTSIYEATLLFFTAKNMLLKCQKRRCVLFRWPIFDIVTYVGRLRGMHERISCNFPGLRQRSRTSNLFFKIIL